MARMIATTDESKELMDAHVDLIKGQYLTFSMFVDSAIKSKLRHLGVKTPEDAIVGHLKKLLKSRQRHLSKRSIKAALRVHEQRMERAAQQLSDFEF